MHFARVSISSVESLRILNVYHLSCFVVYWFACKVTLFIFANEAFRRKDKPFLNDLIQICILGIMDFGYPIKLEISIEYGFLVKIVE